jgi:predicted secreted protein
MSKISGTLIVLDVDSNPIAHSQDATLTINRELPDATTKDSDGWEEHLPAAGLRSAEGSVNGLASYAESDNVDTLYGYIDNRADVTVIFGPESGGIQFEGDAGFSNIELDSPNEEAATYSADWKFNGAPTKNVVS